MTSHNASDVLASIYIGAIIVVLLIRIIWREYFSHPIARFMVDRRPYVRDKQRAAMIAKHPLLQMPKRGA